MKEEEQNFLFVSSDDRADGGLIAVPLGQVSCPRLDVEKVMAKYEGN